LILIFQKTKKNPPHHLFSMKTDDFSVISWKNKKTNELNTYIIA